MPPVARDDKVGYGKPPQSSRWKPGQSGNPKGRPRVDRTGLLQEAALILSEPVTARNAGGATVRLGSLEAAYLAMCTRPSRAMMRLSTRRSG